MRWLVLAVLALGCDGAAEPEAAVPLGARGMSGYRLLPRGATALPEGAIGFQVTADGQGGFDIGFVSMAGSSDGFAGSLTTDVAFNPNATETLSGRESVSFVSQARIDFSGTPGAAAEGIGFAVESGPVYCDLTIAGKHEGFGIYFTGSTSRLVQASDFDPVAFSSP